MKVLHVCSYYSSKLYSLLIEELKRRGLRNTVFYFGKYGYDFPNGREDNVLCVECYSELDRFFFRRKEGKAWSALRAELESRDIDLIHAHSLFSNGYLALLAQREYGVPYVVAVRNTDINVFFKYRVNLRKLGLEILSKASKVVFISPGYKAKLLSSYVPQPMRSALEGKTIVLPNGIDELFFQSSRTIDSERASEPIVLQVGKVSRLKNQAATLKACELLQRSEYGALLYRVVGAVEDRTVACVLDGSPIVQRVDNTSQQRLIQEYRNASVMCMPSLHETFGLSYIEAMSQGTPVIYSKGEGIDGFFSPGEVGYPVDPKSPAEIADAIQRALEGGEKLRNRCIERSRAFRWDQIADRYVREVYGEVLRAEL